MIHNLAAIDRAAQAIRAAGLYPEHERKVLEALYAGIAPVPSGPEQSAQTDAEPGSEPPPPAGS